MLVLRRAVSGWAISAVVAMPGVAFAQTALLLFGGQGHKTFLGCVNCDKYDSGSICNRYGPNGSKYQSDSIWNVYGSFGSQYSSQSPWNKYATDPPAVVDKDGRFYGYFTANQFNAKRTQIKFLVALSDASDEVVRDIDAAQDSVCES